MGFIEADLAQYVQGQLLTRRLLGWRVPLGGVLRQTARGAVLQKNPMKGFPDFAGVTKDGRFWALELKTSIGKLSIEQNGWQNALKRHNAFVGIARSREEVDAFFDSVLG